MNKRNFVLWLVIVCLFILPCLSMAESAEETAYPYEYDTRYKWDEEWKTYTYDSPNAEERGFCTATQEIYAPLLINTKHLDGTITTVQKTVKVGEIVYGIRTYLCYASEDTCYLSGLGLAIDEYYPAFIQIPAQYGGIQLDNSITYFSMPLIKGFSIDEESGAWTVEIRGGQYLLRYISELTFSEEHELLYTAMDEIEVEYDFVATEFEKAEHPDG